VYPTVEVRWFFEGTIPSQVLEWFQLGEREPAAAAPRVDFYLRLADSDPLGIKLRGEQIELKQRFSEYGVVCFHKRVSGRVEGWRKWRFKLAESDLYLTRPPMPASAWMGVKKIRRLRKYQRLKNDTLVAISTMQHPAQGCALELTHIGIEGQDWWSVGLEAFGDEGSLYENLVLVAKHVLVAHEPPTLGAEASCSYPKWLKIIRRSAK
jgi:hypothetical protein